MRKRLIIVSKTAEGFMAWGIETSRVRPAASRIKHDLRVSNCNDM